MPKKLTIFIHLIFGLAVLASFAWLFYKNSVPSGSIEYVQDFENRTPFISDFWPPERIEKISPSVDGAVRPIVESPVSFFVHPPREFATGTISIVYKLKESAVFELAAKRSEDEFEVVSWDSLEALPGDWWRGKITVPMQKWYKDNDGRYRAQLIVPELWEKKNVLYIREVRVKLISNEVSN